MRPDDDLKLGKLLKKNGFRQELMFGRGMLRVEWYASVRELIQGLMKNAFSRRGLPDLVVVSSTLSPARDSGLALPGGLPDLRADTLAEPGERPGAPAGSLLDQRSPGRSAALDGIGFPLATLLFLYIVWRSMLTILWNGGIEWRGTHYPLAELKANRV